MPRIKLYLLLLRTGRSSLNTFWRMYNGVSLILRSHQIHRGAGCSSRSWTFLSYLSAARDGLMTGRPRTSVAGTLARPVQVCGISISIVANIWETHESCKDCYIWNVPAHKGLSRRRSETGISKGTAPGAPDRPSGLARRCRAAAG